MHYRFSAVRLRRSHAWTNQRAAFDPATCCRATWLFIERGSTAGKTLLARWLRVVAFAACGFCDVARMWYLIPRHVKATIINQVRSSYISGVNIPAKQEILTVWCRIYWLQWVEPRFILPSSPITYCNDCRTWLHWNEAKTISVVLPFSLYFSYWCYSLHFFILIIIPS